MLTLISLPPALRLRLQVHSTTRPGLFTKDNVKIAEICIDAISMSRPQRVGKGKQNNVKCLSIASVDTVIC